MEVTKSRKSDGFGHSTLTIKQFGYVKAWPYVIRSLSFWTIDRFNQSMDEKYSDQIFRYVSTKTFTDKTKVEIWNVEVLKDGFCHK